MTTLREWRRNCGMERSESLALVCNVLNVTQAWTVAHDDENLPTAQLETLNAQARARKSGVPMAYIVGTKEFYGRQMLCTAAALVPRPETELLVERALKAGDALKCAAVRVLDVGTGTGCIAITLACERARWTVDALDVSGEALTLAQKNIGRYAQHERVRVLRSSWFDGIRGQQYDIIVSNPPYIRYDDPHLGGDGLRYEPRVALTDGSDGLLAYRLFAREAHLYLRRNGVLLMEHGYDQSDAIRSFFSDRAVWNDFQTTNDLAGIPRISEVIYRPAAISA